MISGKKTDKKKPPVKKSNSKQIKKKEKDIPAKINSGKGTLQFSGGASGFFWMAIRAYLLALFTLGLGVPWSVCIFERWKARNTYLNGRQLAFYGTGFGLLGRWILWLLLMIITLGIYFFWMYPKLLRWKIENTDYKKLKN